MQGCTGLACWMRQAMKSWLSGTLRARLLSQARSPHLLAHTPLMAPHSGCHSGWLPSALPAGQQHLSEPLMLEGSSAG